MSTIFEQFKEVTKGAEITKQEGNFSLLIYVGCVGGCFPPYSNKYYDFDFGSLVFFFDKKHGLSLFDLTKYVRVTYETYKKYIAKQGKIDEISNFKEVWSAVDREYEKYTDTYIKTLGLAELDLLINKWFDYYHKILAATLFTESLDENQTRKYYAEINKSESGSDKFLEYSSKPIFDSFALRIDEGMLKYNKENLDSLQYLFSDYLVTLKTDEMPQAIAESIKTRGGLDKIKLEIEKIKEDLLHNKTGVEKYRSSLSGDLGYLFDFVQTSMYIRDIRKEPMQKTLALLSNTVRRIFTLLEIDPADAIYALYFDFQKGQYKSPRYKEEIARRRDEGGLVLITSGGIRFEYGDIESKKKEFFSLMDQTIGATELKGNVAYKGKVTGKVQIILSGKDFSKFEEGGILVTSMTRPEFVPLMKKASAVITDEGGITCHAAIVSRELKLPCIIGTKNASRILKDGDIVEVDALSGIIKIIK